jgi:hypothetical protein
VVIICLAVIFCVSSHKLFVEVCKDFIGPAKDELLQEEINDVDVKNDECDNIFTVDDIALGSNHDDGGHGENDVSALEYKATLLQKCMDILDVENEECAISEDFMFRIMFHLRYKETTALTQKLLYGYSKYALVEMMTSRVEYHSKVTARGGCKEMISQFLNETAHKCFKTVEDSLLPTSASQVVKKKAKRKGSQQKRKIDVLAGAGSTDGHRSSKVDKRNVMLRRGCTRCAHGRSTLGCRCHIDGDSSADWAYDEIVSGLRGREMDSLASGELTDILVRAMTEDICEHETGDSQIKPVAEFINPDPRSGLRDDGSGNSTFRPEGLEAGAACGGGAVAAPAVVKDKQKPSFIDEEKRIFDMLIDRYGRHMEHNRLDYYSGKFIPVDGLGPCLLHLLYADYLRKLIILGITMLVVLLIALHFV